ncbi:hypothetical protein JB92DRAFT_422660 [Gautieria morchelliformis]|nr:hypothetical protein JB92DRAFT_422660 [Gautieria morchelliformis]
MRRVGSVVIVLAGVFFWRNGRVLKNTLLPLELPVAYFAGGDAQSQCKIVQDPALQVKFCEDAVFWDVAREGKDSIDRRLLVTCDPFREQWNTVMGPLHCPSPRGALWVYTPNSESSFANVELRGFPEHADFHPLGLDVFPGPSNDYHLLIVNHGRDNSTIEQFLLSSVFPYRATYVRTLTSVHFVSPNAVAFTSPSTFYVTQDHRFTRRLPGLLGKILPIVETLLLPGLAWVNHVDIHIDGQLDITDAARGIPFANGIAISGDGSRVAVASSSQGAIQLYSRTSDNKLKWEEVIPLPFSPDNVRFAESGALIAAGHPYFPAISDVAAQKTQVAPSWVVSITPRIKPLNTTAAIREDIDAPHPACNRAPISLSHEVRTLYQSNGSGFSTSSSGLWDTLSNTFFAVGLYQAGVLTCHGLL